MFFVYGTDAFDDERELILLNPALIIEVLSSTTEGTDRRGGDSNGIAASLLSKKNMS